MNVAHELTFRLERYTTGPLSSISSTAASDLLQRRPKIKIILIATHENFLIGTVEYSCLPTTIRLASAEREGRTFVAVPEPLTTLLSDGIAIKGEQYPNLVLLRPIAIDLPILASVRPHQKSLQHASYIDESSILTFPLLLPFMATARFAGNSLTVPNNLQLYTAPVHLLARFLPPPLSAERVLGIPALIRTRAL